MFPKSWKKGRVNPIYKGTGEKTDPGNYRPITILPVLSKNCERAVFDQLYDHIKHVKGKLYSCQSGFRPRYSTETSLLNITDDWFDAIDKGNVIGLVMLDLRKAFDTVHHEPLIDKLKLYDIDDKRMAWFKDYLLNRSHNVSVNGISSKQADSVCGIPQGSILEPLLFIIYINDLPNVVSGRTKVSMYADDTALYTVCKDVNDLNYTLDTDLENVSNWHMHNKLSLNVRKTEPLVLGSKQSLCRISEENINVHINGTKLTRVKKCKHFGVIIDENLSWNNHVQHYIEKRVKLGLYCLNKARSLIPSKTLDVLYKSIIAPHFDYCNIILGTCNRSSFHKVQKHQNRAARISTGVGRHEFATTALSTMKWHNLRERHEYHLASTMYKIMKNHVPSYLTNRFSVRDSGYNLRGHKNVLIPKPRTEFKKRSQCT